MMNWRRYRHFSTVSGVILGLGLGLLVLPSEVWAQRGEGFIEQLPATRLPSAGFAGFFDSNLAEPGSVQLHVPEIGIDIGASENLTVGTCTLATLVPLLGGKPGGSVKLRYRFRSNASWATVGTLYAGGGYMRDSGYGFVMGTSNTTYYVSSAQAVTFTVLAARAQGVVREQKGGSKASNDAALNAGAFALSYEAFPASWFGVQLTALAVPLISGTYDNPTQALGMNVNFPANAVNLSFGRALVEVRTENWLIAAGAMCSVGLLASLRTDSDVPACLPVIDAGRRW